MVKYSINFWKKFFFCFVFAKNFKNGWNYFDKKKLSENMAVFYIFYVDLFFITIFSYELFFILLLNEKERKSDILTELKIKINKKG